MTGVSSITFQYVINALEKATGISAQEMMAGAGIRNGLLKDEPESVDSQYLSAVFRYCMEKTGNPDLALDIGCAIPYQSLGILGYLMLNTRTLKEMIEKFNLYQQLISRHLKFHFSEDGKYYKLAIYISGNKNIPVPGFHAEVHIAAILNILTQILGKKVTPALTHLSQKRSPGRGRLTELLGTNVCFEKDENAVFFKIDDLGVPVSNANGSMLEYFEKQAETILRDTKDNSWFGRVEKIILQNIGDKEVSIGFAADALNVSVRTLQNYLKAEGKSFSMALSGVRRNLAEYYILNTSMDDGDISFLLGYSEVSSFYRAYRKWNLSTPKKLRSRAVSR